MPIQDLCFKEVVSIGKEAPLTEAAMLMRKENVGALVVIDNTGRAAGILTDRDIVVGAVAQGLPMQSGVGEIMSNDVLCVEKSQGVAQVIEQMQNRQVRRAVVVDHDGQPCGFISSDDLIQLLGDELQCLSKLMGRQASVKGFAAAV